jgi:hypothetical protein
LRPTDASTSGYSKQWVTTGGTTLAVTDLRRGVLVKSEDQEEELLSSVFVGGLPSRPGRSKGEKVLIGSGNGVLTLWERGVWDDQDERIYVVGNGKGDGESLDALMLMPEGVGDGHKNVVVGCGNGTVRIVRLGVNKVVGEPLRHDEVEAVVALGFDVGGRMISGGGSMVKVWQEEMNLDEDDDEEEEDENADTGKRAMTSDSDDSDADSDDSDADQKRKKKKRKTKGKKNAGNGILGFKGLE